MTDPTPPATYESRLPTWQQGFNRFCENWIFAFIVAMAIRHFAVEAFRIPTASMEPALYGEQAFTRSDYVVVDKLLQRFRGVQRWDVTVFQFPHPEIQVRGEAVTALDEENQRRDHLLTNPLMYRNFVKRAVILPGDTFFIANGDIHLKGADGRFQAARKPPALQASLWQPIYRHGAQTAPEWYVPWTAGGQAKVENLKGDGLRLTLAGDQGAVGFDQPLNNLYIKPGFVDVTPRDGSGGMTRVEASLLTPVFTAKGKTGNIWHLDRWWANRITTADLDNKVTGAALNVAMRERIGDVRVVFRPTALSGTPALRLREGARQWIDLRLSATGWILVRGIGAEPEQELARGSTPPPGHEFALTNVDDQVLLSVDGGEAWHSDLAPSDPEQDPLEVSWRGTGDLTLATLAIDRDIHYCNNGFLQGESVPYQPQHPFADRKNDIGARASYDRANANLRDIAADRILAARDLRHMTDTREQMLGRELRSNEAWKRIGFSPETAITAPKDAYLLLGDNSAFSWDARNWGWVPAANLRGRVLIRVRSRFVGGIPLPFTDWAMVK